MKYVLRNIIIIGGLIIFTVGKKKKGKTKDDI